MDMSKAVNKLSLVELKENDVLSTEISRNLQINTDDDFVWIEKTSPEEIPQDHLDSDCEADVRVAQHDTNTGSSRNTDEFQFEFNAEDTETRTLTPSDWERELLVEQQYWEQYGSVVQRENNSRPKYPASQRLTVRQYNNIENGKTINRDPSYYKFDISTTATLKTLIDKKYVGPYHNVVGKGKHSVVIYAYCPEGSKVVRVSFYDGNAVKIYKLSNDNDVKKNNAILKRVQREYEHVRLLRKNVGLVCRVPYVVHKMRNVLIFGFIGENQEAAPSISSLQSNYFMELYRNIVKDMEIWYTKLNLVHGKLCTKNLLFLKLTQHKYSYYNTPYLLYIIGWAHSVRRDHPQALIKLMRDCHFVTNFFKRKDVPVKSTEELFKFITGLDKISHMVLDALNKKDLWQEGHLTNPNRQSQGAAVEL